MAAISSSAEAEGAGRLERSGGLGGNKDAFRSLNWTNTDFDWELRFTLCAEPIAGTRWSKPHARCHRELLFCTGTDHDLTGTLEAGGGFELSQ
jgi:hypothetical protein